MVKEDRCYWVPGVPIPQGSKVIARSRSGKVWLRDANGPKLKAWRATVAEGCRGDARTLDGPLRLELTFSMPEPKRPKFDRPAVKPDADKLTRAVADSLTQAGVIRDDARIVSLHVEEVYGAPTGVSIFIREL